MATSARKTSVKIEPKFIPVKVARKKAANQEMGDMQLSFDDDMPIPAKVPFVTARPGQTRLSEVVKLKGLHYDENRREIRAFGSDGKLRVCQVARLTGEAEQARVLWKKLSEAGRGKKDIQFMAAGGFNPNQWFFDIKI